MNDLAYFDQQQTGGFFAEKTAGLPAENKIKTRLYLELLNMIDMENQDNSSTPYKSRLGPWVGQDNAHPG